MRDSEPKRAYYAVGCVRHDAHVMKNFCEQKFFGGSSYSENEKQKRMISVGCFTVLRDSEPKRACNAEGNVRHDAHVIANSRKRKFAGFCVMKIRETKEDDIRWISSSFVGRALRDSNPRPFGS